MLCPVFWLSAAEEQVYSPSLLTASWSRHLWPLLLLHPIHVYPTSLQSFQDFPSNSCVYIFLLQLFPSHPTQANFQVTLPLEIFSFTRKTLFSACLLGTLVTHATFLSRHSDAGLVFPLKQISNSNDSCYHLEISYVPGTVLNTRSIVTLLLP